MQYDLSKINFVNHPDLVRFNALPKVHIPKINAFVLGAKNTVTIITREQENHLFFHYNYIRFQLCRYRDQLAADGREPVLSDDKTVGDFYGEMVHLENQLCDLFMPLVVSLAFKLYRSWRNISADQNIYYMLICDGSWALTDAMRKFDIIRGFGFGAFLGMAVKNRCLQKTYAWMRSRNLSHNESENRHCTKEEADTSTVFNPEYNVSHTELVSLLGDILDRNSAALPPREIQVMRARFGPDGDIMTRKQIGAIIGASHQVVDISERHALDRLRRYFIKIRLIED